jgi:hypothetical protein
MRVRAASTPQRTATISGFFPRAPTAAPILPARPPSVVKDPVRGVEN